MVVDITCQQCGTVFEGQKRRKFCSNRCSNQVYRSMSPDGLARFRQKVGGDKAPINRPGMAAQVRAKNLARGNYDGRRRKNFKGEFIIGANKPGGPRYMVWLSPADRVLYGCKSAYILRSHLVWLRAHLGEAIKRGEIVHHKNRDSLDDRPENLEKLSSQREHARVHGELLRARGGHHADRLPGKACEVCGAPVRPHRRFCSVACTGKGQSGSANPHFGKPHTEATKEAQRARATGKATSTETREKMRQSHYAYWDRKRAEQTP